MKQKTKVIVVSCIALLFFSAANPILIVGPIHVFDVLFGAAATDTPVLMWIIGGALVGGVYGSVAAVRKYRLHRDKNIIPISALVVLCIVFLLSAL